MFQIPCKVAAQDDIKRIILKCQVLGIHLGKVGACFRGMFFDVLPGTLDHGFAVVHPRNLMSPASHQDGEKAGSATRIEDTQRVLPRKLLRDQFIPYLGLNSTKFIRIDGGIGRYPARPVGPDRFQAAPIHNGLTGMTFKKPGRVRSTLASTS